jgi:hypothetical protein
MIDFCLAGQSDISRLAVRSEFKFEREFRERPRKARKAFGACAIRVFRVSNFGVA